MRHTRAHTANRRSHHALDGVRVTVCPHCKSPMIPHNACQSCGKYRGRVVIDVKAALAKKEKKQKSRAKEAGNNR